MIAEGPNPGNLIPSPTMVAMRTGGLLRFEEITRCVPDVQDALVSIMSDKNISIPELPDAKKSRLMSDYGLSAEVAAILVAEKETALFHERVTRSRDPRTAANWVTGDLFDPPIGQQIKVEFRPDPVQNTRQPHRRRIRPFQKRERIDHVTQQRRVVA